MPPRSTRGIPPKRYDPEFETQISRYPVSKESNENPSHSAMAFNTALYSNNVPKNVEEALQDPSGKRQWRKKYSPSIRIKHRRSVNYQHERKLWGVDGYSQSSIMQIVPLSTTKLDLLPRATHRPME